METVTAAAHDHTKHCYLPHPEHDCLTREHGPDEWCADCFIPRRS